MAEIGWTSVGMSALGGLLIGMAAIWLYASLGRIAGISGIAAQALSRLRSGQGSSWPLFFLVGLGLGGWLAYAVVGGLPSVELTPTQMSIYAVSGVIVGIGTRMGSGCTSGHGVCGLSRFSARSLAATLTFLGVGMLTATSLHVLVT